MPSHRPGPLTPTPVIVIKDSGSSSREININSHAESRSTRDGGFVYNSHTTITSESTPPPPSRRPLPPSQQMSARSALFCLVFVANGASRQLLHAVVDDDGHGVESPLSASVFSGPVSSAAADAPAVRRAAE
ncbi:hypothetical protein BBAD15_g11687 [Beauveria bassiana D1-5]|uniref:Uncharacterized protein n=1 Tax=Beauveria bassiana D1-5 TaxID=1245745 RepID=A0A0A2V5K4_BEABA|nr:hypothetical protein BBAD15_g11687 [Beauveria bassiana D1-5]